MTDKEFQQILQDKLTDFSVNLPADDWEAMANQLPAESVPDEAMQGFLSDKMAQATTAVPHSAWRRLRKSLAAQEESEHRVVPFWIWNTIEVATVAAVALLLYMLPTTKQSVESTSTMQQNGMLVSEVTISNVASKTDQEPATEVGQTNSNKSAEATVNHTNTTTQTSTLASVATQSHRKSVKTNSTNAEELVVGSSEKIEINNSELFASNVEIETGTSNVKADKSEVTNSEEKRNIISIEEAERLMAEVENQLAENLATESASSTKKRTKNRDANDENEKILHESHYDVGLLASLSPNMSSVIHASSASLGGSSVLPRTAAHKTEYHDLPFTVGLSVGIPLYERLDLQTGLIYSYCHSKFLSSNRLLGTTTERNQQLHYLGVPVMLSYRIIDRERIKFYTSLGGACEKALVAKNNIYQTDANGVVLSNETSQSYQQGVQGSLTYNLGVAFCFYKGMSLYFEPGFTWYIPSTRYAQPANSRTEHPYNLSLTAGLRFNVK